MTKQLFNCGTDNDGYPTCMGDGSTCARSEKLGEYCSQLPMSVLQCYIEGTQPDGTVSCICVTAGPDTPDEAKSAMVEGGKTSLRNWYPGITGIQIVKDWHEVQLEPLDEDDDQ